MKILQISALQQIEHLRPPGYLEEVKAAGEVHGDNIILTDEAYARLREKFSGVSASAPAPSNDVVLDFFNLDKPCGFPGCEELRAEYQTELKGLPADCGSCEQGALQQKFIDRVQTTFKKGA